LKTAVGIVTVTVLVTAGWAADHEQVLHSFDNSNGHTLISDANGNLYGATQ
jgi:hypothetical protein